MASSFDGTEKVQLDIAGTETVRDLQAMIRKAGWKSFAADFMAFAYDGKQLDRPETIDSTMDELNIAAVGVIYVLYEVPQGGLSGGGISSMSNASSFKVMVSKYLIKRNPSLILLVLSVTCTVFQIIAIL